MDAPYPGDLLVHLSSFVFLLRNVRAGMPGAFERTAHDLKLDRSVLRRRIGTLSSWVGAPLLRGRGTRMVPTDAGARLEERAVTLLSLARELANDVRTVRERIVIACTGTVTTQLIPSVLVELERVRPVCLAVRRAGGSACELLVRSGEANLGVVRAESAPASLPSQHLADDRLWLVLPAGPSGPTRPQGPKGPKRSAKARALSLDEMAALPLVLYGTSSRTRARIMDRLGPRGASVRVEVDGRASALAYVRAGFGATFLSLLPGHSVDDEGVRVFDVTSLFAPSRFYVIGRRDRWDDAAVRDVVARLVHHARRARAARLER